MKNIISLIVNRTPVGYSIVFSLLVVLALICLKVILIIRQKKFLSTLKESFKNSKDILLNTYSRDYIIKKSHAVYKFLLNMDINEAKNFLYEISLADVWVNALAQYADREYFRGILRFGIEEGYFYCFKHSLLSDKFKKEFIQWLKRDESNLKKIAIAGNGQSFNGLKAYKVLQDFFPLIKEMIIYNDWRYRYFSLIILLNDKDSATEKMLFELFKDSESVIRITLISNFDPDDYTSLQKHLFYLILHDPNPEVRKAAIHRYHKTFNDFPVFELSDLNDEEALHLIEALRIGNKDDERLAVDIILNRENLEVRYSAAHFLDNSGALSRFSRELDLSDSEDWERKKSIFLRAVESGARDFLKSLLEKGNREAMLMIGRIFEYKVDNAILPQYIKKAISYNDPTIYELAMKAAAIYNGREEKQLILKEFKDKLNNKPFLNILTETVKLLPDEEYIDPLIEVLRNHSDLKEHVKEALLNKEEKPLINKIISIVKNEAEDLQLKIDLLFVIAELKTDYCLSFLIENLTLIPVKWMSEMGKILSQYPKDILKKKINYYLNQIDGKIRANLIALIPNTELKEFHEQIKQSITDIDPLVRIASTFALIDIGDKNSVKMALSLLRDPVEKVREEVAYALARTGNTEYLKVLKEIFFDDNEVTPVKLSILKGLSECKMEKATNLLLDFLDQSKELRKEIIHALSRHVYEKGLILIIERLKDSGKEIQKDIITAIKDMGIEAKPFLMDLLESKLTRLKEEVSMVMDEIGGTDEEIKKLSHRDPKKRREAAKTLSSIQTIKSFRGLIIASRDPDNEVRVNVIKTLEKLETEEGKNILNALENDPDPKIRKYTHWALERLKAKETI